MKKIILPLMIILLASFVTGLSVTQSTDLMNYWNNETHTVNITVSLGENETNETILVSDIPDGFGVSSVPTECSFNESTHNLTCYNVTGTVQFSLLSNQSHSEAKVSKLETFLHNGTHSVGANPLYFVRTPDIKVVDWKIEYGHGDANYLSEPYISNESATLFNLIRVWNIGSYLDPDEDARNAQIRCLFENYPVRTYGRVEVNHTDDNIVGDFYWSQIQGGYWFRIGVLSQDVSGKSTGDVYSVNCSNVEYDFINEAVKAAFDNYTLEVRSQEPFMIKLIANETELACENVSVVELNITNIEKYSTEGISIERTYQTRRDRIFIPQMWPGDSLTYLADFKNDTEIIVDFIPSWYRNSRNPKYYQQKINIHQVNDNPVINEIGDQVVFRGVTEKYMKQITATDSDNDFLFFQESFSIFDIDDKTGWIVFDVNTTTPGSYYGALIVEDTYDAVDFELLYYHIMENNSLLPAGLHNYTAPLNQSFSTVIKAFSQDDLNLTFVSNATMFVINATNGNISFVPNSSQIGVHYLNVSVNDTSGRYDSIVITLNVVNSSRPLIINYTPSTTNLSLSENSTQNFTINFSRVDNESVSVEWYFDGLLVQNESFDEDNVSLYQFKDNYQSAGNRTLRAVVKDIYGLTAEQEWDLVITNVIPSWCFGQPALLVTELNEFIDNIVNEGDSITETTEQFDQFFGGVTNIYEQPPQIPEFPEFPEFPELPPFPEFPALITNVSALQEYYDRYYNLSDAWGNVLACVNVTRVEAGAEGFKLREAEIGDDLSLPEGFEVILPPFSFTCAGGDLDFDLNIPEGFTDVRALKCVGNECRPGLLTEVTDLRCGEEIITELDRKAVKLSLEDLTIPLEVQYGEISEDASLESGQSSIKFLGNFTGFASIEKPQADVYHPKNTGLKIVGTPLLLTITEETAGAVNLTLPYVPEEGIDELSLAIYGTVFREGAYEWEYIGGIVDTTNRLVSVEVSNIGEYLDEDKSTQFAVMGVLCANCLQSELKKVYELNDQVQDAVVLVHGFQNDPSRFAGIIRDFKETNQPLQVWTYGYPSVRGVDENARDLADLIEINSDNFERLYIVAHSLGGMITQQALWYAYNENRESPGKYLFVDKVRKVMVVGTPNMGAISAGAFESLFKFLINRGTEGGAFNLNSDLIDELVQGRIVPRVPGVQYFVVAGTKPYSFTPLDEVDELNDGIVTVSSAQRIGEGYINDSCHNFWSINVTHTELLDDVVSRRIVERLITEEVAKTAGDATIAGRNQYFKLKIPDCNPTDTWVVVGRPLDPNKVYDPTGCSCGNGFCGIGENEFNCPEDCAKIITVGGACQYLPIALWILFWLWLYVLVMIFIFVVLLKRKLNRKWAIAAVIMLIIMLGLYLLYRFLCVGLCDVPSGPMFFMHLLLLVFMLWFVNKLKRRCCVCTTLYYAFRCITFRKRKYNVEEVVMDVTKDDVDIRKCNIKRWIWWKLRGRIDRELELTEWAEDLRKKFHINGKDKRFVPFDQYCKMFDSYCSRLHMWLWMLLWVLLFVVILILFFICPLYWWILLIALLALLNALRHLYRWWFLKSKEYVEEEEPKVEEIKETRTIEGLKTLVVKAKQIVIVPTVKKKPEEKKVKEVKILDKPDEEKEVEGPEERERIGQDQVLRISMDKEELKLESPEERPQVAKKRVKRIGTGAKLSVRQVGHKKRRVVRKKPCTCEIVETRQKSKKACTCEVVKGKTDQPCTCEVLPSTNCKCETVEKSKGKK